MTIVTIYIYNWVKYKFLYLHVISNLYVFLSLVEKVIVWTKHLKHSSEYNLFTEQYSHTGLEWENYDNFNVLGELSILDPYSELREGC